MGLARPSRGTNQANERSGLDAEALQQSALHRGHWTHFLFPSHHHLCFAAESDNDEREDPPSLTDGANTTNNAGDMVLLRGVALSTTMVCTLESSRRES